jgi:hypothetical protein
MKTLGEWARKGMEKSEKRRYKDEKPKKKGK